ncbi:myosin phosphatase Rho-interacting protein-like isoform X2 [Heptranchias perlo]|uniref:myosin phosphatase Rho-interacting protein-like isoform X2 n=1 Tax=Heptranchias perlo TaxID=212740 RepID=UPI0035598C49
MFLTGAGARIVSKPLISIEKTAVALTSSWQEESRMHNHLNSQITRKWAVDSSPSRTSELSNAMTTRAHSSRGERTLGSSASPLLGESRNREVHSESPTWAQSRSRPASVSSRGRSEPVESRGKTLASKGAESVNGERAGGRKPRVESGYFSLERAKSDSVHNLPPAPRRSAETRTAGQAGSPVFGGTTGGGLLGHGRLTSSQSSFESESSWGTGTSIASSDARLFRRDYTALADIPKPRRIISRETLEQDCKQLGQRTRTRSPGREEVERLFGQERRPVTDTYREYNSTNVGRTGRESTTSLRLNEESRKSKVYPRKFQKKETDREISQQPFSNLLKSKGRDVPTTTQYDRTDRGLSKQAFSNSLKTKDKYRFATDQYDKVETKLYLQKDELKICTRCSRPASEANKVDGKYPSKEELNTNMEYLRSSPQNDKMGGKFSLKEESKSYSGYPRTTLKNDKAGGKFSKEESNSYTGYLRSAAKVDGRFSSQEQSSHTGYLRSSPNRDQVDTKFSSPDEQNSYTGFLRAFSRSDRVDTRLNSSEESNSYTPGYHHSPLSDKTDRGFSNRTASNSLNKDVYVQTTDKHEQTDRGFSNRTSSISLNKDVYLTTDKHDKTDQGFSNRTTSNLLNKDVYLTTDKHDKTDRGFSNRTASNSLNKDVYLQTTDKHDKTDRGFSNRTASNSLNKDVYLQSTDKHDKPDLLNFKKGWMSILDDRSEWKKHWFVLTDSSLRYYRDSTAEEADDLDGEIDLRSCNDVTEYQVQRNYGFQIHTKEAVHTLSAMTSGIRRNWIEALRKNVRPITAPDVTKRNTWMKTSLSKPSLTDSNKENTFRDTIARRNAAKQEAAAADRTRPDVQRSSRRADGHEQRLTSFDYVELEPVQLLRGQDSALSRAQDSAKVDELQRDQAQRIAERSRWFESANLNDGPRKGAERSALPPQMPEPLGKDIEVKWLELERIPLRDHKQVPIACLRASSTGVNDSGISGTTERLKKEISSLNLQLDQARRELESFREQSSRLHGHLKSSEELRTQIPKGFISQATCERGFREMEDSHRKAMEELQRQHKREMDKVQHDKDRLLSEETDATISAIEAVKKAHREELEREMERLRSAQHIANNSDLERLHKQHQEELESLQRELQVLSEQYSRKCLEISYQMKETQSREKDLSRSQRENEELLRQNQELNVQLSEEIARIRALVTGKSHDNFGNSSVTGDRDTCELEVLLRVKENEVQNLRKETLCLRDELQSMQWDKKYATDRYNDIYTELSVMKVRTERELFQVKEQLKLAMAALEEKESLQNSIAK